MPLFNQIQEWLGVSSFSEIFQESTVRNGFIVGLAVGVVLPLGIRLLIWLIARRRSRSAGITIHGEHGDLHVSVAAVREFVIRIVSEFREASLRSVHMRRLGSVEIIDIGVNAVPGTDLVLLHTSISQRVREEAAKKLGLDESHGRVNVVVDHYSADEARIAKRVRRVPAERDIPLVSDGDTKGSDDSSVAVMESVAEVVAPS